MTYLIIMVFFISGCANQKQITLDEIGQRIEQTINSHETQYLNSLLSYKLFLSDSFNTFKFSRDQQNEIIESYKEILKLGNTIYNMSRQTGGLVYLKKSQNVLTFNVNSETTMGYIEFIFEKEENELKISDVFVYEWGCTLSEQLVDGTKVLSKDIGDGRRNHQVVINQINKLVFNNQIQVAKERYNNLSHEFRNLKMMRAVGVSIALRDSTEAASTFIDKIINKNPSNEKFLYYLMFIKYHNENDCNGMISSSNYLKKYTGPDPVLEGFINNCGK